MTEVRPRESIVRIEASSKRSADRIVRWVFTTYGVLLIPGEGNVLEGRAYSDVAPAVLSNVRHRYQSGYVWGAAEAVRPGGGA